MKHDDRGQPVAASSLRAWPTSWVRVSAALLLLAWAGVGCRQVAGYTTVEPPDGGLGDRGSKDGSRDGLVGNPPPLRWAQTLQAAQDIELAGVAYDDKGNGYVAGTFAGKSNFAGASLVAQGSHDGFLARLLPSGALGGSVTFGAFGVDLRLTHLAAYTDKLIAISGVVRGKGTVLGMPIDAPKETVFVALLSADNFPKIAFTSFTLCETDGAPADVSALVLDDKGIFLAGVVEGSAKFLAPMPAGRRAFVVAYEPDFTTRWRMLFGGDAAATKDLTTATALALGPNYVYVAGSFGGQADLTRHDGGSDSFNATGRLDGYVARIPLTTPTGWELVNLKSSAGSSDGVYPQALAYDSDNKAVHVAGRRNGALVVSGSSVSPATLGDGLFIVALDTENGPYNYLGAWQGEAKAYPAPLALAANKNRLALATRLQGSTLPGSPVEDVIRLDLTFTNGSYAAAGHLPLMGSGEALPSSVALDQSGRALVAGRITGAAQLAGESTADPQGTVFVAADQDLGVAPPVTWASFARPEASVQTTCGISDAQGNIYLGGSFSGRVDFDPTRSNAAARRAAQGTPDAFVVSYDQQGQFRWLRTLHSTSPTLVKALTLDGNGDLFVVGTFIGPLVLDTGLATSPDATAPSNDLFVLRAHADDGAEVWLANYDSGSDLAGAANEDVIAAVYDPGAMRLTLVGSRTKGGPADLLIVRFQPTKDELGTGSPFPFGGGGPAEDRPMAAALLADGSLLVGGYVTTSAGTVVDLGKGARAGTGGRDAFLTHHDLGKGTTTTVTLYGGPGNEEIVDLAATDQGIAIVGTYDGDLTLGAKALPRAPGAGVQGFVAMVDIGGKPSWAKPLAGEKALGALRVAIDASGELRLVAHHEGKFRFDTGKGLPGAGAGLWIGAVGADGRLRWHMGWEAPALTLAGAWLNVKSELVVVGSFDSPLSLPAPGPALQSDAQPSGFVAVFNP